MAPKKRKSVKKTRRLKIKNLGNNRALTKVFSYRASAKDENVS